MEIKRAIDVFISLIGLIVLSPVFFLIAIAIKIDSRGPVFFRQERIGLRGKPFHIHKFRSMFFDAETNGLKITISSDHRVTRVGCFLRSYKLDELPQLIDVFFGKMSLVGPRPEVSKYVSYYPSEVKKIIFSVRPGVTDNASIFYRSESKILGSVADPEKTYIEEILPKKLRLYVDYVQHRSFWVDFSIILRTLMVLVKK